jgi:uncharacterized protein (DUF1684 family)
LPFQILLREWKLLWKYIDLTMPKGNTIAIDFNKSYNPYCAYNYKYSCPKVPWKMIWT